MHRSKIIYLIGATHSPAFDGILLPFLSHPETFYYPLVDCCLEKFMVSLGFHQCTDPSYMVCLIRGLRSIGREAERQSRQPNPTSY